MKEEYYKIEKSPSSELLKGENFRTLVESPEVRLAISKAQENYLSWQDFRKKNWISEKKESVWAFISLQREFSAKNTPISDANEKYFKFNPHSHVEFLHQVDLELGGHFIGIEGFGEGDKQKFIRRNLIEESIASSQLEGANTSRQVAKEMLKKKRPPSNKSEQMILNNHETMKFIEAELKHEELSVEVIKDLHRRIIHKTIDEKHQGIFRETLNNTGNPLVIKPWGETSLISYTAPSKEFVEEQILKLVDFANDKDVGTGFIHPLIKGIMLHFWIGLLHPFEDGNGRLARILFYWYMLRKKYWAFSYLSISEHILKSPAQYAMAYIYSEQDKNDLNYFIHYNIEKLKLARKSFGEYVERKIFENKTIANIVRDGHNLNHRQLSLLQYMAKGEQVFTTLVEYIGMNKPIAKMTAVSDLKKLVEESFLQKIKTGRNVSYYPTDKIKKLFS
ncbi:MAG: Fic family protein [Pseudomonadota bacterium]